MATETELTNRTEPSIASLVQGIVHDAQELLKQQLTLFKAEMKEDFAKTRNAGTSMAAGLVVVLAGVLVLAIGLAHALDAAFEALPLWGAFLIVGVLVVGAGGAAAYAGFRKFQSFNPLPDQSVEALKENLQWTKPK